VLCRRLGRTLLLQQACERLYQLRLVRPAITTMEELVADARQGAAAETVRHYWQHYGLLTEQEARQRIEFLSSPLDRSYIFTYYWGQKMLKALFALKPERRY
jgi:hypothetical protein